MPWVAEISAREQEIAHQKSLQERNQQDLQNLKQSASGLSWTAN